MPESQPELPGALTTESLVWHSRVLLGFKSLLKNLKPTETGQKQCSRAQSGLGVVWAEKNHSGWQVHSQQLPTHLQSTLKAG